MKTERDAHLDVHHHAVTEKYRERLRLRATRHSAARVPEIPEWTVEKSLCWMDASGVHRALLSAPARGFGAGGTDEVVAFARAAHDELLGLRDRRPDRFGVLAPLPLPSLDHAVEHAERALRHDAVDGIALLTQYAGRYVGEPVWDDLLELLDRQRALVHVHPTAPAGAPLRDHLGPHLVEYTFDTTRVAVLLAKRRVFTRYPGIRWVFAHGGGTLPYVIGRLDDPPGTIDGGDRIEDLLRASHFDSALLGRPALAALTEFAGPDHVVFGSDAPFIHGDRVTRLLDDLTAHLQLSMHQELGDVRP
ncbi:amidohydrolase family protein [Saccharomonospora sp. NPDC046836]|uniref:amidohydrolase family protein n=1 Tax=Saccharomonospora sp. NPDC046836 TaxID=3156921 RepID=UPI00340104E9